MKPHCKVDINVGTLRNMTHEQLDALKENMLNDGKWESEDVLHVSGGDYLGVTFDGNPLFIGIEKDGYTHS